MVLAMLLQLRGLKLKAPAGPMKWKAAAEVVRHSATESQAAQLIKLW